jgi:hypothetical protein
MAEEEEGKPDTLVFYRLHELYIDATGREWDNVVCDPSLTPEAGSEVLLPTGVVVEFDPDDPSQERAVVVYQLGRDLRDPIEIIAQRDARPTGWKRENVPHEWIVGTELRRRIAMIYEECRMFDHLDSNGDNGDLTPLLEALSAFVAAADEQHSMGICRVPKWTGPDGPGPECGHAPLAHHEGVCVRCMVVQPVGLRGDVDLGDEVPIDVPVHWQHEFEVAS